MLLSFEHIENPFLDLEYLPYFNNLNILFFEVLAKKEKTGDMDIFGPADCFGNMMKELFIFKQDIFTDILSQLAFDLVKFIIKI